MKFNLSLLGFYLFITVFVKIVYTYTFLNISFHKMFYSNDKIAINNLDLANDEIEWTFFMLVFLLMTFVFYTNNKNVVVTGHLKHILLACGTVGLYTQLQKKHFFGLFTFLHV